MTVNAGDSPVLVAVDKTPLAAAIIDGLVTATGCRASCETVTSLYALRGLLGSPVSLSPEQFRTVIVNVDQFEPAELEEIGAVTDESCLVVALHERVLDPERADWVSRTGGITLRSGADARRDVDALAMVVLGRPTRSAAATSPRPAAPLVFLSYASEDELDVRGLQQQLADERIGCWLDADEILPGQVWDDAIRSAIGRSSHAIVCLSTRWTEKRGFVQQELDLILEEVKRQPQGAIYLIPVRLEPCDVPDRLRRWQSVDLFRSGGFVRLLDALRAPRVNTV